jgi:hypothetical protein
VVLAVGGNTTESIKIRHLVKQIAENSRNNNNITVTSTESSFMTPSALVAAESLQVQRQAFLSVILSYLAKPEENPDISLEGRDSSSTSSEGNTTTNNGHHHGDDNNLTAGQSWSRFADSHIHLRVLRSTSEEQPEARALFFGRSSHRHNNNRRHHQFQRPGSAQLGPPISNSAELVNLLRENLNRQRRRNHLVNGEAEETSATIEVVQTRTPFVMMDGEMIMNDLPMVVQ